MSVISGTLRLACFFAVLERAHAPLLAGLCEPAVLRAKLAG